MATTTIVSQQPFFQQQQQQQKVNDDEGGTLQSVRTNKAWKFVEKVEECFQKRYVHNPEIQLLETDDVFSLTERFLECQHKFRATGKPVHVQVAFHYTRSANLDSICQDGLVSGLTQRHGASFGQGIYVGNNPHAFSCYGQVGLVLLILKGTIKMGSPHDSDSNVDESVNTFTGNKLYHDLTSMDWKGGPSYPTSDYFDEFILRKSEQALPIAFYERDAINNAALMHDLHCFFQSAADSFFNGGNTTRVRRVYPNMDDIRFEHKLQYKFRKSRQKTHQKTSHSTSFLNLLPQPKPEVIHQMACPSPSAQFGFANKEKIYKVVPFPRKSEECPICMVSFDQQGVVVSLCKCQHSFHKECLKKSIKLSGNKCPICRKPLGEPRGKCPGGSMTIKRDSNLHCAGHLQHGTLILEYSVPSGIQSAAHPAPGHRFTGFTERIAYLPDTRQGQKLLQRLKYSFSHGLTFSVGTSLTTGKSNQVVWAIHHKTSLSGGAHGWPDMGYFINANEELDTAGVPNAIECEAKKS